jgi:membrane protein implicated in regulation of membrane protease activity
MDWWLWIALGLALTVAELVTPSGFFIIFFGVAALSVGMLTALNMAGGTWVQWLLFSVLSLLYVMVFRGRLQTKVQMPESRDVDSLIGVLAIVQERMLPGAVGKVEVRGSMWSARNSSNVPLDAGQRARVAAVDGLTLTVVPE